MTVCLLLAAGSSSRMGKAKMLLPYNGKTLLQHVINEIKNAAADRLVVVTGCYHQQLKQILEEEQIDFIENKSWQEGMGSSIQTGVGYIIQQYPTAENIVITVCDQPHISAFLLNELIAAKQNTGKGIIAAAYNNTEGTPVLFDKKYFGELTQLKGPYGAKRIVQQHYIDTETVDFPEGTIDIDTAEEYENLLRKG